MAKGYWIARVDVTTWTATRNIVAQNGEVFAKYGARFLCAAASMCPRKAPRLAQRGAGIQDYETALGCLQFAEYVRLVALAQPHCEATS